MKTLVLLSGGLDSATVLAWADKEKDQLSAIGFDYGQAHRIELTRAKAIASDFGVPFEIVQIPTMPKVTDVVFAGRNLVFAAIAVAKAQAGGFERIAVGCNQTDWERFPDCRPAFWSAFGAMAREAYGVGVAAPLLRMTKTEVAALARQLGVPVDLTWSCYSPRAGEPCGECLACTVRQEALSCSA